MSVRLQVAGNAVTDPEDQPWLWREAYLADPDGNPIMLFHAGENRVDPPGASRRPSQPIVLASIEPI